MRQERVCNKRVREPLVLSSLPAAAVTLFCQNSLHHIDNYTALHGLEPTFLAFLRNLTFWLFLIMVSFLVTIINENSVGEPSLPKASAVLPLPHAVLLESSFCVSLSGHLPGVKPSKTLLSPAPLSC